MLFAKRGGRARLRTIHRADLGQSEIENLCVPAIGHEQIGGLDVAMNDAFA